MQNEEKHVNVGRPTNRAMRRRPALLQQANEDSCSQDILGSSHPETLKPRRLETHTWHAKRMQMISRHVSIAGDAVFGSTFVTLVVFVLHSSLGCLLLAFSCLIKTQMSLP